MTRRRKLLERDVPVVWRRIIAEIRKAGYGTSDICSALNVSRGCLWHWEHDEEPKPSYEDGRALLQLHASCVKVEIRPYTGTFAMQMA